MTAQVLVLASLETKAPEANYLMSHLTALGLTVEAVDISLSTQGRVLSGVEKTAAMAARAHSLTECVAHACAHGAEVVVGLGGGTGGQIIMDVMRALPITFPKLLVTTLPFDPRFALADNAIMLVPTLSDICGLNSVLRDALQNTAHMAKGLCGKPRKGELKDVAPTVGITALGSTDGAVGPLVGALHGQGHETTVFHSNGFGGAAFARFAGGGMFKAIVDMTPHELTRINLAGIHVDMPTRFTAGGDLPRVVLPGGLNFIGLGQKSLVQAKYLSRPHYEHSGLFTHVQLLDHEMEMMAWLLAQSLNALTGPRALVVPMGGFSHQDKPGGEIEGPGLRDVFLATVKDQLSDATQLHVLDAHLFDPAVTDTVTDALTRFMDPKDPT